MRITPSSSFLLATLAISSSSSSIAAPTEPGSHDVSTLASSYSTRSVALAGRDGSARISFGGADYGGNHRDADSGMYPSVNVNMSHNRRALLDIVGLLGGLPLVGPILEPLLSGLLAIVGLEHAGPGAESVIGDIAPEQISQMIALLTTAAQKLGKQVQVGSGPSGSKRAFLIADASGTDNSTSSSASQSGTPSSTVSSVSTAASFTPAMSSTAVASSTTVSDPHATSIEAMALPIPPSAAPPVAPPARGNGTAPPSPPLPVNPPNTPIPAPAAPKLPVPAGVSPPSGPIPRDAPPMFPAFQAADASPMSPPATASSIYAPESSASGNIASTTVSGGPSSTPVTAASSTMVSTPDSTATPPSSASV